MSTFCLSVAPDNPARDLYRPIWEDLRQTVFLNGGGISPMHDQPADDDAAIHYLLAQRSGQMGAPALDFLAAARARTGPIFNYPNQGDGWKIDRLVLHPLSVRNKLAAQFVRRIAQDLRARQCLSIFLEAANQPEIRQNVLPHLVGSGFHARGPHYVVADVTHLMMAFDPNHTPSL